MAFAGAIEHPQVTNEHMQSTITDAEPLQPETQSNNPHSNISHSNTTHSSPTPSNTPHRKIEPATVKCRICASTLEPNQTQTICTYSACKKKVHRDCWRIWEMYLTQRSQDPSCVFCRRTLKIEVDENEAAQAATNMSQWVPIQWAPLHGDGDGSDDYNDYDEYDSSEYESMVEDEMDDDKTEVDGSDDNDDRVAEDDDKDRVAGGDNSKIEHGSLDGDSLMSDVDDATSQESNESEMRRIRAESTYLASSEDDMDEDADGRTGD